MTPLRRRLLLAIAATAVFAGGAALDRPGGNDQLAGTTTSTGMSVSGSTLLRDGRAFVPRGFNTIGTLTPSWCGSGVGTTARNKFGSTEMSAFTGKWYANTIRMQVSQEGLGDTAAHSATQIGDYVNEIKSHVATARSAGLVVILSMQDQSIGCGGVHQLPTATTVSAWRTLVGAFANNPYVMFELFNEPQNDTSSSAWNQWRNGGSSPLCNSGAKTSTCATAVGHQQLVNDIRGWGADNVLIADGGRYAEHFDGVNSYLLNDTAAGHGIAYAAHPYYFNPSATFATDAQYAQNSYGFLVSGGHTVIATEWDYNADKCGTDAETLAPQFLTWLEGKGIGMTAMAGDFITHTMADWSFNPTYCGGAVGGNGKQLLTWYRHLAQSFSITGLSAAPQPLVTKTTISFTLSAAATVNVDIEKMSGTIVKHKLTNVSLPAGVNSTVYYGYDDNNAQLAAGAYVVVVSGTDSGGHTARATAPLQIG